MAAGGNAPGHEPVRVETAFSGIGAQPAHGRFKVVNLSWEFGFLAQTICDLRDGITVS
jgi:hypothetical protein